MARWQSSTLPFHRHTAPTTTLGFWYAMCAHAVQQDLSRSSPAGIFHSTGSPHCSQNAGVVAEESPAEWRRAEVSGFGYKKALPARLVDASNAKDELKGQRMGELAGRTWMISLSATAFQASLSASSSLVGSVFSAYSS